MQILRDQPRITRMLFQSISRGQATILQSLQHQKGRDCPRSHLLLYHPIMSMSPSHKPIISLLGSQFANMLTVESSSSSVIYPVLNKATYNLFFKVICPVVTMTTFNLSNKIHPLATKAIVNLNVSIKVVCRLGNKTTWAVVAYPLNQ